MKFKKTLAITLAAVMGMSAGTPLCVQAAGKKLSVMIWDNNQLAGLQEIMDKWTEESGVAVEVQVVTWEEYWTLLEAGAQGGSLPDVFWMHSNEAQRYMEAGMLLDLTDKISGSEIVDMSKFPEDIVSIYTLDGKNYAMPKDIDTIALWYNKTMFDEAGIDYPDETWTWDTFQEAAKKLTLEDGSQYGYASLPGGNQDGFYNLILSHGGYIISEDKKTSGMDDEKTIEAMEQFYEIIRDSMPPLEVMSESAPDVLFRSGKAAMSTEGSWMVASYRDNEYSAENCDVAVLPKDAVTGRRVSIYNGLGWAAAAEGKNTQEAWQLLEYLGSEEAQKMQADLGVTMSAYEGTSDAWVKCAEMFHLEAYLDMMEDMEIRPYSRNTVKWETNLLSMKLKEAWTGDKSMADVCRDIADEMNTILAEE